VVFGEHGLATALTPARYTSTCRPLDHATIRSIAGRFPKGVAVVDAPVRGSISQAAEGRLEIFVGASDEDFERVRPILAALGSVVHVGGPGAGSALKLVANLALGTSIAAVGEALALVRRWGLAGRRCSTCSRARNWPGGAGQRTNIESGHYPPTFKLRHAGKDLRLVVEAAAAVDRDLTSLRRSESLAGRGRRTRGGRPGLFGGGGTIVGEEPKSSSRQLLSALTGQGVQVNKAIVGRNAFAHEAGIHQDGILKDRRTYEIMEAGDVGVPWPPLVLGKHSGRHAVHKRLSDLGLSVHAERLVRGCIER